jgi:2-dehydropantoate 2-reductase
MKVCVFGAGALGGHLAAQLIAGKNCELSLVARGAHLAAIREHGLTLKTGGREVGGKAAAATDNPTTLPPQDIVFVALKAQTLPAAAAAIGKLIKPDGCAVFLMNGIPWWFNHGLPGNKGTLPLLDPDGALWREVRPERTIGSVIYSPNEVVAPGVVVHTAQNRWVFGEPDLTASTRLKAITDLVRASGIETEASPDIRRELFRKLANNASNNTLCSLTRVDSSGIADSEGLTKLSMSIIGETLSVAAKIGWDLRSEVNVEQVATRARGKPGQKPSTLQDVLAGKSLEIDGLLGQTQAFAREHGVATPVIDVCLPLLRGLDTSLRAKQV